MKHDDASAQVSSGGEMKPKRKTYCVEYWACLLAHRHKSEERAARCIAKVAAYARRPVKNEWSRANLELLIADVETGATLKEIGVKWGVSGGRIGQLIFKAIRKRHPYDALSDYRVRQEAIHADRDAMWQRNAEARTVKKSLLTAALREAR